jgi:hypothetical protein
MHSQRQSIMKDLNLHDGERCLLLTEKYSMIDSLNNVYIQAK